MGSVCAGAQAIVDFETAIAQIQWTNVENRNPVKTYNKVMLADMAKTAPGFNWQAWLDAAGIAPKTTYVIVSQPTYLKAFTGVAEQTSLDTWKAYLRLHLIEGYASYLSKAYVDERFSFYGTTLSGVTQMEPRWKRGVGAVERTVGESVGKLYVEQNFPAERKARMEALVGNLLAAYKDSINKLDWMSPEGEGHHRAVRRPGQPQGRQGGRRLPGQAD